MRLLLFTTTLHNTITDIMLVARFETGLSYNNTVTANKLALMSETSFLQERLTIPLLLWTEKLLHQTSFKDLFLPCFFYLGTLCRRYSVVNWD